VDDLVAAILAVIERRRELPPELPPELPLLLAEAHAPTFGELQQAIGCLLHGERWKTTAIPAGVARAGAVLEDKVFDEDPFIRPWMIDIASDRYECTTAVGTAGFCRDVRRPALAARLRKAWSGLSVTSCRAGDRAAGLPLSRPSHPKQLCVAGAVEVMTRSLRMCQGLMAIAAASRNPDGYGVHAMAASRVIHNPLPGRWGLVPFPIEGHNLAGAVRLRGGAPGPLTGQPRSAAGAVGPPKPAGTCPRGEEQVIGASAGCRPSLPSMCPESLERDPLDPSILQGDSS